MMLLKFHTINKRHLNIQVNFGIMKL